MSEVFSATSVTARDQREARTQIAGRPGGGSFRRAESSPRVGEAGLSLRSVVRPGYPREILDLAEKLAWLLGHLPAPGDQVRYLCSGSAVGVDAQVTEA
jgi:hypothetical protein